jgi:colanic acid biosynthesis glycosyl transferase WcaI
MLSDLAFALSGRGYDVHVITSRQRYDDHRAVLPAREMVGGVEVRRVWTSRFGRHKLAGRALDYLTFYASAAWALWRLARAGDVIVAKTDPPLLSTLAAPIAHARGARLVNWLQDVFPEVAEALGASRSTIVRAAFAALRWLRDRSLECAAMNVAISWDMAQRLRALDLRRKRVCVIPNWADGRLITPIEHSENAFRRRHGLSGKFVVCYSGNLGRAHEYRTFLDAIAQLEKRARCSSESVRSDIAWLFIGGGAGFEGLRSEVERLELASVRFMPYQPQAGLAQSLSAADVHLVSLRPELEGLILPSKFYGIAAAGRPTLFVGDEAGEVSRMLAQHASGRSLSVGDAHGLAQAILELATSPDTCRRMGERARRSFDAHYAKAIATAQWEALIEGILGATRQAPAQPERVPAPASAVSRNAR